MQAEVAKLKALKPHLEDDDDDEENEEEAPSEKASAIDSDALLVWRSFYNFDGGNDGDAEG